MRYSLRTLVILMLLAGPFGAWGWKELKAYRARRADDEARVKIKRTPPQLGIVTITGPSQKFPASSPAADEIWLQQRGRITWESFPESQPAKP